MRTVLKTARASKVAALTSELLKAKSFRKPRKDAGKKRGNYKMPKVEPEIKISDEQAKINTEYQDLKTVKIMGKTFTQVQDKGIIRYVPAN